MKFLVCNSYQHIIHLAATMSIINCTVFQITLCCAVRGFASGESLGEYVPRKLLRLVFDVLVKLVSVMRKNGFSRLWKKTVGGTSVGYYCLHFLCHYSHCCIGQRFSCHQPVCFTCYSWDKITYIAFHKNMYSGLSWCCQ